VDLTNEGDDLDESGFMAVDEDEVAGVASPSKG